MCPEPRVMEKPVLGTEVQRKESWGGGAGEWGEGDEEGGIGR